MLRFLSLLVIATVTHGYNQLFNRRNSLKVIATGAIMGHPSVSHSLDACNPKANNCVFTTWTPPSGSTLSATIKDLRSAIQSYPQEGQNDVDGGGWTIASDELDSSGVARVEYRSSGKGFFARNFNGGRPFVDDLNIEITDGKVRIRSQSRVGDSDFGVNKKRVSFLATELKEKGWGV